MSEKILFVDDEPAVLEGLGRVLRKEGYEILAARSSQEAMAFLRKDPVDVVISDERMPEGSGVEFLTSVRREYPDTVRILLTGHADAETAIRAINQGEIYRFLTKPCDGTDLIVTIRKALEHRKLLSEAYRLWRTMKAQTSVIEELEKQEPGITRVKRDSEGMIVLENPPENFDAFMRCLQDDLDKAEREIQRRKSDLLGPEK